MKTDWIDFVEAFEEKICNGCPHFHKGACMGDLSEEGEDNFEQMIVCVANIEDRLKGVFPEAWGVIPFEENEENGTSDYKCGDE